MRAEAKHGAVVIWMLALLMIVAGCRDLVVDPAPVPSAQLNLSFAAPPTSQLEHAGDAGTAFDRADAVQIRLLREGSVAAEVNQEFQAEGSQTRIPMEVEVEGDQETFLLELALLWQGATLFEAQQSVTLQSGEANEVQLSLEPVPAGVEVQDGPVVLDALEEQAQLDGAVIFATGDRVPGQSLTWSSSNPQVVEVSQGGVVTAIAEGQVQVQATHGSFSSTVGVEVRQAVASVAVSPSSVTLGYGSTVQLDVALSDSRGHPISPTGRSVAWSSSDPDVATVDGEGVVQGMSDGTATITATSEGTSGSASVTVEGDVGSVVGGVADGTTGEAIVGAEVDFGDGRTASSDSGGRFAIELPEGSYTARVTAEGYAQLEITEIEVVADQTTEIGTVELFPEEFEGIFGVWAYREVLELPEVDSPDYLVFQPPQFLWDVDDLGSCFEIDEANVEVVAIDGDLWTFRDLDDGEEFTYRIFLQEPDVLRIELQDEEFDLTFIFDRTSLTVDDFEPVCASMDTSVSLRTDRLTVRGPTRR